MFTVLYARDPVSFQDCPTPCGYRYCHELTSWLNEWPIDPSARGTADHADCQLAEAKLYSNGIAAETNTLKRALHGGAL